MSNQLCGFCLRSLALEIIALVYLLDSNCMLKGILFVTMKRTNQLQAVVSVTILHDSNEEVNTSTSKAL